MKKVSMNIDGKTVEAQEGATILETAEAMGIHIPHLCYNEQLKVYGGCRLCMVEITKNGKKRLVASCAYPVEEGLVVETSSEKVKKIRRMIIELIWPVAQDLGREYGVTASRFRAANTDCSLCGICVRYCAEVKGSHIAYFKGRGIDREIALVPGMGKECLYCRECFNFCKGSKILQEMDRVYA
ncbi:2Fe-2S and 4Fe-4S iron-sulfur protein [uncultured Desulfobacterium sp.]|uniref:2Fe-2S and 4Fe-4S iron-sulfur protein n=1 Tax=uncultured Desulfobacterium sp. TaxID=201089 RepID=A0A445MTX6_9BACT|nr:2Fe-2S and 4Fe-4S iron-sulfur protein [uncultured Desulfobacterium sp.]